MPFSSRSSVPTVVVSVQTQFTQPDSVPDDCIEAIAGILKELDSIEISEDGYQIRRKDVRHPQHPLPATCELVWQVF